MAALPASQFALVATVGTSFRSILIYALSATVALIVVHWLARAAAPRAQRADRQPWTAWERLVYAGVLSAVGVLAASAFGAIGKGETMSGWPLMLHMVGAGVFTVALPALAVTWSAVHLRANRVANGARFSLLARAMFWALLLSGLAVMGTMLVSMLPWLGTHELEEMLDAHRFAGLAVVIVLLLHAYAVLTGRRR
ncbi:MAG: hypothetical protein KDA42_13875 [Planctomycetales bacterium]|nr:hypothetical protein [Planctomycetales bacterium]